MASDTPTPFRVSVKTISGEKYLIEISPEDTVEELKKRLEAVSGLPNSKMRLIFQGKALVDSQKLGPDCKIQDENVVHMVEKVVPTEGAGAGQQANQPAPSSSASSIPMNVAGPFMLSGTTQSGGAQGPNVVIRALHVGFDPNSAILQNSSPTGAGQPQGSAQPTGSPAIGTNAPNAGAHNAYHQHLTGISNQINQMLQAAYASPQNSAQQGSSIQNPPNSGTNAQRTAQSGAVPGAAPMPTHAHIQLNLPTMMLNSQTLQALSQQWTPFETHLLPQFENFIRTLASDIIELEESFHAPRSLPTRTYEINMPRTVPTNSVNSASSSEVPVTLQSLWKRVTSIQRRWLAIVESIEGDHPLFGTEEAARESRLGRLPSPMVAARATRPTDLPLLLVPITHPLRHLLEHWAPQVTMQLTFALSNLYPLLSQHHNQTHHNTHPRTHGHAHSSHQTPQTATTSNTTSATPAAQQTTPHPPSSSSSTSSGDNATFAFSNASNQASSSVNSGAPADFNHIFRGIQSGFTQLLQSFGGNQVNPETPAASPENGQSGSTTGIPEIPSSSPFTPSVTHATPTSPETPVMESHSNDKEEEVRPVEMPKPLENSDHPEASIVEPIASSSAAPEAKEVDDIMSTWDSVIARDVARQSALQTQSPFSHAYAQNTFQDSLISPNSTAPDRDLLEELLRTAEEAIPGATTSGLPLSNTPLPPALLSSFQSRLAHHIQSRLSEDSDWSILQARGQTETRFPNLHRLQHNQTQPPSKPSE